MRDPNAVKSQAYPDTGCPTAAMIWRGETYFTPGRNLISKVARAAVSLGDALPLDYRVFENRRSYERR